jgi:predicted RND superfamily exporter protein
MIHCKTGFDDSLQNWIPQDSPAIQEYRHFLDEFKSDAFILVSVHILPEANNRRHSISIDSLKARISSFQHIRSVQNWPLPFLRFKSTKPEGVQSFIIRYNPPSHTNPNRPELIQKVTNLLIHSGYEHHIAGTGVIHKAINDMTRRSLKQFLGIGMVILIGCLLLFVRDHKIIIKMIGISIGAVSFLIIAAYLLNVQFNMIMSILLILILFYSTSISVHVVSHGGEFRKVLWPSLMAVLTTCAGFSAFLFESSPLLMHFGLLAILGLISGFLWAVLLFKNNPDSDKIRLPYKGTIVRARKWWNKKAFVCFLIMIILFIPGIFKVQSEIDTLSILPVQSRAVQDYLFIQKNMGPYIPVEYLVDITNANENRLRQWVDAVYKLDEVGGIMSYLQLPQWIDPRKVGYASEDGQTGRITFFIPIMSTTMGLALVEQIDQIAQKIFEETQSIPKPTGYVALYVSVADHLAKSFQSSLLLAFIFIFFIVFFYVHNIRVFIATILPNLFPVLSLLGVMGWLGIPLDMVTFPIGCLALGIIVDDTIHFLYWYRKTKDTGTTMVQAGPGIIVTSILAVAGFAVFLFAEAPPVRYFGLLCITAMVSALFGDIIILPFMLKKTVKDSDH